MHSVDHVEIWHPKQMITGRNYFPNAKKLTISSSLFNSNGRFLFPTLSIILPLEQLTQLNVMIFADDLAEVITLLADTPNIHTLDITPLVDADDLVQLEQDTSFQLVSTTNNIKRLTVRYDCMAEVTKFLLTLFPQVEYLALKGSGDNLTSILRFLLPKHNKTTPRLTSLYMKVSDDKNEALLTFMQSKTLLDDDSTSVQNKVPNDSIYLWW